MYGVSSEKQRRTAFYKVFKINKSGKTKEFDSSFFRSIDYFNL